jgi:hypothetical protein
MSIFPSNWFWLWNLKLLLIYESLIYIYIFKLVPTIHSKSNQFVRVIIQPINIAIKYSLSPRNDHWSLTVSCELIVIGSGWMCLIFDRQTPTVLVHFSWAVPAQQQNRYCIFFVYWSIGFVWRVWPWLKSAEFYLLRLKRCNRGYTINKIVNFFFQEYYHSIISDHTILV